VRALGGTKESRIKENPTDRVREAAFAPFSAQKRKSSAPTAAAI